MEVNGIEQMWSLSDMRIIIGCTLAMAFPL